MELPVMYHDLEPADKILVRNSYINIQKGKCWYCNCDLNGPPPKNLTDKYINWNMFPPKFLKNPIHLQHDHKTGLTEGAVHAFCNAYLWHYHRR